MDAPKPYLDFFVPGRAAPGGSKRGFYSPKLKRVLMTPASKATKPWMAIVSAYAMEAMNAAGQAVSNIQTVAMLVWIEFLMERPKKHFRTGKHAGELRPDAQKWHTVKPDLTKLCRSTEDAMSGIVWRDDSLIAMHNLQKRYANPNETPGAHVKVFLLEVP